MRFAYALVVHAVAVAGKHPVIESEADLALSAVPPPVPLVPVSGLPEAFSWRRVAGYGSLLTPSQNQHVPQYCGACFAFASFHTLADRVKIARYLALRSRAPDAFDGPDLVASIQVMLNCGGEDFGFGVAGSCATGGSASGVYRWVKRFGGVPTATCFPYLAADGLGCAPDAVCRNCMPSSLEEGAPAECWAVTREASAPDCVGDLTCAASAYPRIAVSRHGKLPSAADVGPEAAALAMQVEIARAGPIACNVDALKFLGYSGRGLVDENPAGARGVNDTDHVIEIVGWGVEKDGVDYWEVRNSWGEYWGDFGFARVRRGVNDQLIESGCAWVHASGWGIPGAAWQTADLSALDAEAASLVALHGGSGGPESSAAGPWPSRQAPRNAVYVGVPVAILALVVFTLRGRHTPTKETPLRSMRSLSEDEPCRPSLDSSYGRPSETEVGRPSFGLEPNSFKL